MNKQELIDAVVASTGDTKAAKKYYQEIIAPSERLLRLSVGIEAESDLIADLDEALSC